MWEDFDNLEQYTRKIQGVPEDAYVNTEAVVMKVAEALNVTIRNQKMLKFPTNQNVERIIVKFVSHKVKTRLYKERTKLKHVKISDLFPGYPSTAGLQRRIFINENLTAYRREIVEAASKRRREGTLLSV